MSENISYLIPHTSYFSPMNHRLSFAAWLACALILFGVTLASPRFLRPATEATLAWDVSGYYLYLPAIFIYKDLKQVKFLPGILEKYTPSFAPDQAYPCAAGGNQVMKYPAGMAVLYLPFFLLAHLLASVLGYPADGFSLPYQVCIHLGSVLVAVLGLWFLRKNLLHFFSDRTAGIVLALVALGTNFFNYATFDAAMPHVYLFALLALLIHFTIRIHAGQKGDTSKSGFLEEKKFHFFSSKKPDFEVSPLGWGNFLGIGFCIGMAALVRPTEVIFALVPLLWNVTDWQAKWRLLAQNLPKIAAAALLVGSIGFLQLAYWKFACNSWLVYSYQDQGFNFAHPHVLDVLFSYRKGWFVYTPLMLFAVAGFFFLAKNQRRLLAPVLAFFLVTLWIVSAWDIWWYAGAFSQRAMVQSYPLLAFPLAALVGWVFERGTTFPKVWNFRKGGYLPKAIFSILFAAFAALNLFQTWQAHDGGMFETEAMNRAYFWRIFGKTKNDPFDRLLLDSKEGFFGEKKNEQPLYATDFEAFADTAGVSNQAARSGKFSWFVDPAHPFSPAVDLPKSEAMQPRNWLHVSGWFFSPQLEYEPWWMPQLVVRFEKNGQVVRERAIRPMRVMQPNQWQEVSMNIRFPRKDFDNVKIFLWNVRDRVAMYADDLKVETFQE